MAINTVIKEALKTHKNKIELTQWAVTSGITSLLYSEYIRRIQQRMFPTRIVFVPYVKKISELIHPDGQLMQWISENLIDRMIEDELFRQYMDHPEFEMFKPENVEILKTILDLYIIRNIERSLPDLFIKKFRLGDPTNQLIRESPDIDLFYRHPFTEDQFDFIVHEIVLQQLLFIPSLQREVECPTDNMNIHVAKNEIVTIENENAACPIHFDKLIIENKDVIDLLSFVTNSTFTNISGGEVCATKNDEIVEYSLTTGVFNQVAVVRLQSSYKPTADEVKALRELTGAGLMECKKALIDSNGDEAGAIEYLKNNPTGIMR